MDLPLWNTSTDNPHHAIITDGRLRRAQLKMLRMLKVIDAICLKHNLDYWLDAGTLLGAIRHKGFIPWDDDMDIAMPRESYEKFLQVAADELPDDMYLQQAGVEKDYYNLGTPLKIRDRNSYYLEKYEKGTESYLQGIFIDVFVYDKLPKNTFIRKWCKRLSRKALRILGAKHSVLPMGRNHFIYKTLGLLFSKIFLNKFLNVLILKSNKLSSPYLGRGYHCKKITLVNINEIYPLKRGVFENHYFNIPNQSTAILSKEYGEYQTLPPEAERTLRHCIKLIPD